VGVDSSDYIYNIDFNYVMYVSKDSGNTWNLRNNFGDSPYGYAALLFVNNRDGYFANDAIFQSKDSANTWKLISSRGLYITGLAAIGNKIFYSGSDGVFMYDPSAPIYVGSNYFPQHVGNTYQYFSSASGSQGDHQYNIYTHKIISETQINNNTYYQWDSDSLLRRYSETDKKIYVWDGEDKLFMDFNLANGDHFYQYAHDTVYKYASLSSGEGTLFSQPIKYKEYNVTTGSYPIVSSRSERFAEGFGVYSQSSGSSVGHMGYSGTGTLIMAIIIDSLGNRTTYSYYRLPQISFNPITSIRRQVFRIDTIRIDHQYNRYPYNQNGGLDFIDSTFFESYYKKNDQYLYNSRKQLSFRSIGNYCINYSLDTLLLKDGYTFNYRVMAIDKGIIPDTAYLPASGYYECNWDFSLGAKEDKELIRDYVLYTNYPNPFNSTTIIKYSVPLASHVTLKISNVLGQCILEENLGINQPGVYSKKLDLSSFPSGIYLYSVSFNSLDGQYKSFQNKKMCYLK
jgi:hypothetical protein